MFQQLCEAFRMASATSDFIHSVSELEIQEAIAVLVKDLDRMYHESVSTE